MHIIEVVVSPQGETTVTTKGFFGAECLHASKWLDEALGIKTKDVKTAEFHQQGVVDQQVTSE